MIEISEVFSFGKQLGFALPGAALLWGFLFWRLSRHEKPGTNVCLVYQWIASRLLWVFFGAAALAVISWIGLFTVLSPAQAHEGIVLVPEPEYQLAALRLVYPVFAAWLAFSVAGLLAW